MAKRVAETDLTDKNWNQEDEGEGVGGGGAYPIASDVVLKSREIKKAIRRNAGGEGESPRGFKGLEGIPTTSTANAAGGGAPAYFGFGNGIAAFSGLSGPTNGNSATPTFGSFSSPTIKANAIVPALTLNDPASSKSTADMTSKQTNPPALSQSANGSSLSSSSSIFNSSISSSSILSSSTSSGSNKDYDQKLIALNLSVRDWITKNIDANPLSDLSPIFRDYEQHLVRIEEKYRGAAAEEAVGAAGSATVLEGLADSQVSGEKPGTRLPTASTATSLFSSSSGTPLNSFGQDKDGSAPSFSFGNDKDGSAPLFSFGNDKDGRAPSFSFGNNKDGSAPSFSFGNDKDGSAPSFSFGNDKDGSAPSFPFGNDKDGSSPEKSTAALPSPAAIKLKFGQKPDACAPATAGVAGPHLPTTNTTRSLSLSGGGTLFPIDKNKDAFSGGSTTPFLFGKNKDAFSSSTIPFSFPLSSSFSPSPFGQAPRFGSPQASAEPIALFPSNSQRDLEGNAYESADTESDEPPKPEVREVKEADAFHSVKCKLFYNKDSEYKEKGVGTLHLKHTPEGKTQLIVRADTNLGNILLNVILQASMPCSRTGKNNVLMVCVPNPPMDDKNPTKPMPLLVRVKTTEDANELHKLLEENRV